MRRTATLTVRLGGALGDFVSANVGESGSYENVSEYIRDLIRRDKERSEREAFEGIAAGGVSSLPIPAPFGVDGYVFRYRKHFVYWKRLSNGDIGTIRAAQATTAVRNPG